MFELVKRFFDSESFAPHGVCLLWKPELVWLHVISDAIIVAAYYSIPIVLVVFIRKRPDVGFGWVFWCFAIFIMACGTTHLLAIWTLWRPDYAAEGLIKAMTASASIATAGALWPLLPTVLRIPSPAQLRVLNKELVARVAERDAALVQVEAEAAERSKIEEKLRQSQKMEALGQLTAGVAHDFNNLLSVVILNLERLEREIPEGGRGDRARATALEASRRAALLTGQMLTYARQRPLERKAIDVAAFLRAFEPLARNAAGDRKLIIETRQASLQALADEAELTSALLNLVVNARDATGQGGRITVTLSEGRDPDMPEQACAVITVRDDGAGMPPEVLSRAFDPFFTTKGPGKGSGLGLSQVFGFARGCGGSAAITSQVGRGTTVTLSLPLVEQTS
jgi:signal transduction histidine kinase